ncbi:MAG: class I SAM-dependent methyltransferase, partial [Candidatus Gracilibacteria bacterium]|nr:class I SAM-dependent methyltransferase [Candidatus Gracilibacteria bacterium]
MKKINIGKEWTTAVKSTKIDREFFNVYEKNLPILSKLFIASTKGMKNIEMADFGGGIGVITDRLKKDHNNKINIFCTCLDSSEELLKQNQSADSKMCIDIRESLGKEIYDIGLMRYVLNYNTKGDQLKIMKNIHTALRSSGVFINCWCGVSDIEHQKKFQDLFNTKKVNEKLYRLNSYWTTWQENKELFEQTGFDVKIVKEYRIPINQLYKVRYELSDSENEQILKFLEKYKFINY